MKKVPQTRPFCRSQASFVLRFHDLAFLHFRRFGQVGSLVTVQTWQRTKSWRFHVISQFSCRRSTLIFISFCFWFLTFPHKFLIKAFPAWLTFHFDATAVLGLQATRTQLSVPSTCFFELLWLLRALAALSFPFFELPALQLKFVSLFLTFLTFQGISAAAVQSWLFECFLRWR